MTFKIDRNTLNEALIITGKAIGDNLIMPIVANYLFTISNNVCDICTTNMETFIKKSVPIISDGELSIAIPSRLAEWVLQLPSGEITFDITDGIVKASQGKPKITLPYEPGEHFPFAKQNSLNGFTMQASELQDAINKTLFCVHSDTSRGLSGVKFELRTGVATFVSCNLAIMSTAEYTTTSVTDGDYVLSPRSLAVLLSIPFDGVVGVNVGDKYISFAWGENSVLHSILLDMPYENWRSIIRAESSKVFDVNRMELLGAMRRSNICADDKENLAVLKIDAENCFIKGENNMSERADESVSGTYTGEPIEICINAKNMINCLTRLQSERVVFNMESHKHAIFITLPNKENNLMMVAPLVFINE